MTSRARVAVIVLHYEDRELTRRCVESLARALGERDLLIVVDNSWNLEADSLDGIPGSAPVVCRPAERNPGFSRGMNHGGRRAAEANPEWFLFVNNDTVFDEHAVDELVAAGARPDVGAVAPVLRYLSEPDRVWSAGGSFRWWSPRPEFASGRTLGARAEHPYETDFLSGCVLMFPAELAASGAPWPEAYLFGGEEWEVSWRLRRSGRALLAVPGARVLHDARVDEGHGRSHSTRDPVFILNSYSNRLLFLERNRALPVRVGQKLLLALYLLAIAWARWPSTGGLTGRLRNIRFFTRLTYALFLVREPNQRLDFQGLQRTGESLA